MPSAPWAEGLLLQKVVAQTNQVSTPLDRVIANDLVPVADYIQIRFRPHPGKARRVSNHGIGNCGVNKNSGQTALKCPHVDAWNSQLVRCACAVINLLCGVAVAVESNAVLHNECRREGVVPINGCGIGLIRSASLESASYRAPGDTVSWPLKCDRVHVSQVAREMIVFALIVVDFYVKVVVILPKWSALEKILR